MVVLTGACQTGKTSTSRRLFPRHGFVSLDLPTEVEQAEKEPEAFLRRHPAPLLIDEVQYAPRLFRHLEAAADARRGKHGQYLLTGSQKFTLMKGVSELPTASDASNLTFVRAAVGKARLTAGAVV